MQTLPVITTPPVTSVQQSPSADNAPQPTESFGNVLARQRANAGSSTEGRQANASGKQEASAQGASTQGASAQAASAASGKDSADAASAQAVDAASAVAGDMLKSLLPAVTATDKSAPADKADTQASALPAMDASALPGNIQAALLPVQNETAKGLEARDGKGIQDRIAGDGRKVRQQPVEAGAAGARGAAGKTAAQTLEAAGDSKLAASHMHKGEKPDAAAVINTGKEKAFAAALEASAKGGAKAAQLDAGLAKARMKSDTPTAMENVLPNMAAPLATSQNGAAQPTQAVINTPVTDAAWGGEFNQKITWMATQQQQTAELHLNPPNLGPLDVVLNVDGDKATALFTSPHAAVRDAVEQALPRLRDMMADNGITLGNAMVSDQSPKDQQAWQAEQRQGGSRGGAGSADAAIATGTASVAIPPARRHLGMVDTFV